MDLDTKEFPFRECVDVEMPIAADGNTVEPTALLRRGELWVLQPHLQLVTARLEPQELGGNSIREKTEPSGPTAMSLQRVRVPGSTALTFPTPVRSSNPV